MLKGQLPRVPGPGNSWIPHNFPAGIWALQQPPKHSYSLQLAIHTQLEHCYLQYAL